MNLFDLAATISLDTTNFDKGLDKAEQATKKMGETIGDSFGNGPSSGTTRASQSLNTFSIFAGNILSTVTQEAIGAFAQLVTGSIDVASDLQESQNVVDTTFGESASVINQWAKDAKTAYGMSELSAKKYNGTMGAMLKSMGMTDEEVLNMSTSLVGLAGDMASFYNLDHDTAFDKIRAGISGETEPLKQLGINMSVANLEAFALANGIEKAFDEMSEAEKTQLRYEYLMESTADAQGDFAKTAGSYANQSRILALNVETLQKNIGNALLPVVTSVITAINNLFASPPQDELSAALTTMKDNVEGIKTGLTDATAGYTATMTEIDAKAELAKTYLAVIQEMEGKEVLTEEESARLANAASALEYMYGIEVTDENNRLVKTHEELTQIISDLDEIAKRTALDSLLSKYRESAGLLAEEQIQAQALIDKLSPQIAQAQTQIEGLQAVRAALQENGFTGLDASLGEYASLIPNFDMFMTRGLDGSWSLRPDWQDLGIDPVTGISSRLDLAEGETQASLDELEGKLSEAENTLAYTEAQIAVLQQDADALETAYEAIVTSSDSVKESAEAASSAVDAVGTSIDSLPDEKIITIKTVGAEDVDGSHETGLNYVPYDGYIAELHKGEQVLTELEANNNRREDHNGAGEIVTVNVNLGNVSIRDERDIETLAQQIAQYTRRQNYGMGAVSY